MSVSAVTDPPVSLADTKQPVPVFETDTGRFSIHL